MRVVRNQSFEPVLLAGCSGSQTDTQQQCLLYNQYEYGRYQEGGKPVGGVEDGYVLILDGVGCISSWRAVVLPARSILISAFMASDTLVLAVSNAL